MIRQLGWVSFWLVVSIAFVSVHNAYSSWALKSAHEARLKASDELLAEQREYNEIRLEGFREGSSEISKWWKVELAKQGAHGAAWKARYAMKVGDIKMFEEASRTCIEWKLMYVTDPAKRRAFEKAISNTIEPDAIGQDDAKISSDLFEKSRIEE